jgi:hypothetical protein
MSIARLVVNRLPVLGNSSSAIFVLFFCAWATWSRKGTHMIINSANVTVPYFSGAIQQCVKSKWNDSCSINVVPSESFDHMQLLSEDTIAWLNLALICIKISSSSDNRVVECQFDGSFSARLWATLYNIGRCSKGRRFVLRLDEWNNVGY